MQVGTDVSFLGRREELGRFREVGEAEVDDDAEDERKRAL